LGVWDSIAAMFPGLVCAEAENAASAAKANTYACFMNFIFPPEFWGGDPRAGWSVVPASSRVKLSAMVARRRSDASCNACRCVKFFFHGAMEETRLDLPRGLRLCADFDSRTIREGRTFLRARQSMELARDPEHARRSAGA